MIIARFPILCADCGLFCFSMPFKELHLTAVLTHLRLGVRFPLPVVLTWPFWWGSFCFFTNRTKTQNVWWVLTVFSLIWFYIISSFLRHSQITLRCLIFMNFSSVGIGCLCVLPLKDRYKFSIWKISNIRKSRIVCGAIYHIPMTVIDTWFHTELPTPVPLITIKGILNIIACYL